MKSNAALPAMWALANLIVAQYGQQAVSHAALMAKDAVTQGDHDLANIWQDVAGCIRQA